MGIFEILDMGQAIYQDGTGKNRFEFGREIHVICCHPSLILTPFQTPRERYIPPVPHHQSSSFAFPPPPPPPQSVYVSNMDLCVHDHSSSCWIPLILCSVIWKTLNASIFGAYLWYSAIHTYMQLELCSYACLGGDIHREIYEIHASAEDYPTSLHIRIRTATSGAVKDQNHKKWAWKRYQRNDIQKK